MNPRFDVLVIGAGVVGLSSALAMGEQGHRVALIDAGSLETESALPCPRVYAISPASEAFLAALKVWPLLDPQRLAPYRHMHVWDGVNGQPLDFDCRQIAANHLGTIVEESLIKQALLQQIARTDTISLFPNCSIESIVHEHQTVQLISQEQVWEGQLVMIADGAQSPTRNKLKVPLTSWSYHQNAIVATVETEKPHQQTAYQVFNPDGPLAFLPLPQPYQCSVVWSTTPSKAQALLAMNDDAFNQAITLAFAKHLGQTQVISPRHGFPLHMRHVKQYSGPSWMLLGDAAHTIHPLAGLGLNVGLADLKTWMNLMNTMKGDLQSARRLGAYQRERKHALWQVILLMEGLKRVFGPTPAPINFLRSVGLRACNEWEPIKRFLVEQACG